MIRIYPNRKMPGRTALILILVCFLATLVAFGIVRSIRYSFGFWGLVGRLAMLPLLLAGYAWGLWRMVRDAGREGGSLWARTRNRFWCAVGALLFAWLLWYSAGAFSDLVRGPVTREVRVTSITGRHLFMVDVETGERIGIRIGNLERRTTLRPVYTELREATMYHGDVVRRAIDAELVDGEVYCTITYYPWTYYRVSVEDLRTVYPDGESS